MHYLTLNFSIKQSEAWVPGYVHVNDCISIAKVDHYLLFRGSLGKGKVSAEERGMYSNPDFIKTFNFKAALKQDKQ